MTHTAQRAATDQAFPAMIAGAIPLIDVAGHLGGDAEASRQAAGQLRWAVENVGFDCLAGHGVRQSLPAHGAGPGIAGRGRHPGARATARW